MPEADLIADRPIHDRTDTMSPGIRSPIRLAAVIDRSANCAVWCDQPGRRYAVRQDDALPARRTSSLTMMPRSCSSRSAATRCDHLHTSVDAAQCAR